jgi:hypothetical protein
MKWLKTLGSWSDKQLRYWSSTPSMTTTSRLMDWSSIWHKIRNKMWRKKILYSTLLIIDDSLIQYRPY